MHIAYRYIDSQRKDCINVEFACEFELQYGFRYRNTNCKITEYLNVERFNQTLMETMTRKWTKNRKIHQKYSSTCLKHLGTKFFD